MVPVDRDPDKCDGHDTPPSHEAITIRPSVPNDADGIARVFLESARHHASLDPERYSLPAMETVSAQYREGQHPLEPGGIGITLVAEFDGEIVGFLAARLDRSPDLMHRDMIYCHVAEIAVGQEHRGRGVGRQLLREAEDWGGRHGATFASLEYHAANVLAGVFYARSGYSAAAVTAIKRL